MMREIPANDGVAVALEEAFTMFTNGDSPPDVTPEHILTIIDGMLRKKAEAGLAFGVHFETDAVTCKLVPNRPMHVGEFVTFAALLAGVRHSDQAIAGWFKRGIIAQPGLNHLLIDIMAHYASRVCESTPELSKRMVECVAMHAQGLRVTIQDVEETDG